jgi:hypothetical protein
MLQWAHFLTCASMTQSLPLSLNSSLDKALLPNVIVRILMITTKNYRKMNLRNIVITDPQNSGTVFTNLHFFFNL